MPIRFIDAYGTLGSAAVNLDALAGALTGDVSAPINFTGSASARLADLSASMIGQYVLDSSATGNIATTLSGVAGYLTGDTGSNPLYPPSSIGLVFV